MVDLLTVQPLPEAGDWPVTIPRIEDGWYPTGGDVNPAPMRGSPTGRPNCWPSAPAT